MRAIPSRAMTTRTQAAAVPQGAVVEHPRRWRMLALIALTEVLGMATWFAANAVAPQLAARWSLTPSQTGWLSTAVQLGFVAGTAIAAVLNLADVVPARAYVAASASAAAIANAL